LFERLGTGFPVKKRPCLEFMASGFTYAGFRALIFDVPEKFPSWLATGVTKRKLVSLF